MRGFKREPASSDPADDLYRMMKALRDVNYDGIVIPDNNPANGRTAKRSGVQHRLHARPVIFASSQHIRTAPRPRAHSFATLPDREDRHMLVIVMETKKHGRRASIH
jgi:hypothetical protein